MARLIGPGEASREAKVIVGNTFQAKRNRPVNVYSDAAATLLADILTIGGTPIAGSAVTTDAYSMLPLFQFPDGVDTLWVVVDGGPAWPIYARDDDRHDAAKAALDALGTRLADAETVAGAAETPSGAQAKASAAQAAAIGASTQRAANLADLANAATARTNLGLAGAATRNVGTTSGTVAAGDAPANYATDAVAGRLKTQIVLTSAPLAVAASYTSAPYNAYGGPPAESLIPARLVVTADVSYDLVVQSSADGSTGWTTQDTLVPALVGAAWTVDTEVVAAARYIRFVLTATAAQTSLTARVVFG